MDANASYDPDLTYATHSMKYIPSTPTIAPCHDGKLETLISSCGLARHHSSRPFPPSHIRGSQRINYIFVTPGIFPATQSSGSLSYHTLFQGDHRAYYLDFDAQALFSDRAYEISPAIHRKLCLQDPWLVHQYRASLHVQLQAHNAYHKLETLLQHVADKTWTDTQTVEYLALDTVITKAMLYAESKTGRTYTTTYDWSPKLKQAVQALCYWHLRL
jgi:hypothetical protein